METQNMERKESWNSEWLRTVCAFANTDGGVLIIGIRDKGEVIGVKDPHYIMKLIPDDIRNKLDVKTSVKEIVEDGKTCIKITVEKGDRYVDLDGVFYKRVGNTTQKVTGEELRSWILSDKNISWTDLPAKRVKVGELSQTAIELFVKKGMESGRMSSEAAKGDRESLLKNYDLMDEKGLHISGAVLFFDNPRRESWATPVKVGAFSENGRLLRDDIVEGPVVFQPDKVMDLLMNKYVLGTNDLDGLMRVVKYPYPMKALREAVMNAIVHRDYSSVVETDILVYPDHIMIRNPGDLPRGWTTETLLEKHPSKPTNKAIAGVFYDMKYIERYGSGIGMIREECKAMGLPEPEYSVTIHNGFAITFRLPEKKDVEVQLKLPEGLTANEAKICELINENAGITASEMAERLKVSESTVNRALRSLTKKGIIIRFGPSQGGHWKLFV